MSVSAFEQDYVLGLGGRQIYARPLGIVAASMIGIAALATLGLSLSFGVKPVKTPAESEAPQKEALASPQGGEVAVKPSFAFDLAAPEFTKEKKTTASRDIEGGHEDSLTLGQFAGAGPYLRLDLRQMSGEKRGSPDFFLDLTRHAGGAGLSAIRIGQPSPLATRFGAFEAADIRLTSATPDGVSGERVCVALRSSASAKGAIEIAGLACGAGAKPMDRRSLGCMIDRLELAPGANVALEQFFEATDAERAKACGVTSSTEKTNWFEAHSRAPEAKPEALPPKHTKKAR
jgi:hypothetical protein